jgi:dienelactone hydrolase
MATIRRLSAIMFTDIVGYTALMQQSESVAIKVRHKHRQVFEPITQQYGGKIIQYYGDGTLSIFDSAIAAVQCACAMQQQFLEEPAIPVRIGIHSGDILVSETEIIGDSVNLASRVESLGVAGSVLISEKVAEEIANQDELPAAYLGDFHFKNDRTKRKVYAVAVPGLKIPARQEMKGKLEKQYKYPGLRAMLQPTRLKAVLMVVFLLFTLALLAFIDRQLNIRWAKREALPEIERLVEESWRDYTDAYRLALKAEKYIPQDAKLQALIAQSSHPVAIESDPPGARVYIKAYHYPDEEWAYLGETPLEKVRLPIAFLRWKLEKEGYETVLAGEPTYTFGNPEELTREGLLVPSVFKRTLDKTGSIPPGMTRVQGGNTWAGEIPDFFIDIFEVTNAQYLEFVTKGGYRDRSWWQVPFVKDGVGLSWDEAMKHLVDQTGQPGPASWRGGVYPEGEANYPVSGVSWYEAKAYAAFAGKSLPGAIHWALARGVNTLAIRWPQLGGYALYAPYSNYTGKGPVEVGTTTAITPFGCYDMAGNVREWCENEMPEGRLIRGGAWEENTYTYGNLSRMPPFDRNVKNGFRCAWFPEPEKVPLTAFAKFFAEEPGFKKAPLVDDAVFAVYKERFAYDKLNLNTMQDARDSTDFWIQESVSFDAAYGAERMSVHLFLPRNAEPPYQTVIYFPGAAAEWQRSSAQLSKYYEFTTFLSFFVKNGRAVLFPVYKGTFERQSPKYQRRASSPDSYLRVEYYTYLVKDFQRSIDYLETRSDIDIDKLAYYGMSWGGGIGPLISAVEDRLKACILLAGGVGNPDFRPEIDSWQYAPRVKIPTLMINGKYDSVSPVEESIQPLFDALGTPEAHKALKLFESDHIPSSNDFIRESLEWLDRYLGPVKYRREAA